MASGKSGYVEFTSSASWGTVRVYYTETYDVATNKSTLTVTAIKVRSTNWYQVSYYPDGVLKINGVTVLTLSSALGDTLVKVQAKNSWYNLVYASNTSKVVTAKLENIEHNSDGGKTVDIELTGNRFSKFNFFTPSGKYGSGWTVDAAKPVELTDIPRASTIGASDANIESSSTVVVSKKASAYTHSIRYTFGKLSGYLKADGGISATEVRLTANAIAFKLPKEFYDEIPAAAYGTCTLQCTTYSGSTKVGDTQTTTFRATASKALCAPMVSGEVYDALAKTVNLTGNEYKLVRYFSKAYCEITAEAKNGATIVSRRIGGVAVLGTYREIPEIETDSVLFSATDSRGYTTEIVVKRALVNYVKLTCNVQLTRDDPTSGNATLLVWGDYFNSTFGSRGNSLALQYRVAKAGSSYGAYQPVAVEPEGSGYAVEVALTGLDYTSAYAVQVNAYDALMSLAPNSSVGKGEPVCNWGENDFTFNVPVRAVGGPGYCLLTVDELIDRGNDGSEHTLNTWLDDLLSQMPNGSERLVRWVCSPAVSGYTVCAQLYKHDSQYASMMGHSYDGKLYHKTKYAGVWNDTTVR